MRGLSATKLVLLERFFYLFKIPAKTPEQPKKKHKINHFDFH